MPKPAGTIPTWNTGGANQTEPNAAKKILGWTVNEVPPSSYFNWILNKIGAWIQYLDAITGEALTWTAKQTFSAGAVANAAGADPGLAATGTGAVPAVQATGGATLGAEAIKGTAAAAAGIGVRGVGSTDAGQINSIGVVGTAGVGDGGAGVVGEAGAGLNSHGVEGFGSAGANSVAFYGETGTGAGSFGVYIVGSSTNSTVAVHADAGSGSNNVGVSGTAGTSIGGIGVRGRATSANNVAGVQGDSTHADADGVRATKSVDGGANTAALSAIATAGYGALVAGDVTSPVRAALRLVPQDSDPSAAQTGDLYVNTDGTLRIYNGSAWVKVGTQT